MEQTITMMSEEEIPEVGPNDIVIHLVNPYKCGLCELEFLEKSVFKEHMFSHLEQIKQERPSSQIVMSITLPPETPGGVTVTRDILQLGEDGSIKQVLQPTHNMTLNQVSPLRELEEAGVIKLDFPKPPEVIASKRIPVPVQRSTSTVTHINIAPQTQPLELIQDGFSSVVSTTGMEDLLKQTKADVEGNSEVSEIGETTEGFLSFAFKGPNDEMQHIQIIRPEGAKAVDMMLELTNAQGAKPGSRGNGNKNNICDICGKVLSSSTNLLRHKMYHSAERPFVCEVCNKGFKDVCNLKKHTMIHKRIFPCYLCKKSFLRKSLLALHLRRHEARTALVKTGNSMKEVTMRTFVDEDGTRVEEMSMAALGGQTFEYKQRIVKADPGEIDRQVKKEIEAEIKELAEAVTSTEGDTTPPLTVEDSTEKKTTTQKTVFMVTSNGLQETVIDQSTSTDDNSLLRNSGNSSAEPVDADDMPDLKIPVVPEEFVKMYQCGHCGKRTVQRGNMMRHLIHHLKEKPFACDECPKQFVDKGELVKHKKTHSKPYRCPQCNGAFAHNAQLLKHLQGACLGSMETLNYTVMEDGKTYRCDICRIEMKRLGNMIKHVGTHSRKSSWNRNPGLAQKKINFLKSASGETSLKKPDAAYYYDSSRRAYFCGFCSKSFSLKLHVQQHVRVHTNDKPFPCPDCKRWFPCAATLKRHLQVHTKPFKCEKCPSAFSRKLFLDSHKKKHNEKERVEETLDYGLMDDKSGYFCKHCEKKLQNKYRMMSHVRGHLNKRPFECMTCNKCFSHQYMLMNHKKIHTKPFVCKVCGETFSRKFFLIVHKKKTHSIKKEEVIEEAMETFDEDDSVSEDRQVFPCSICGAPFARLVIKMNHEKKCSEESKVMMRLPEGKGFKCKICGKIASLKHNLMVHIRKHTDIVILDNGGRITVIDETFAQVNESIKSATSGDDSLTGHENKAPEKSRKASLSVVKRRGSNALKFDSDSEEFIGDEAFDEEADFASNKDGKFKRTPGGFICLDCRRKFTDLDTLVRHLEDAHGENVKHEKVPNDNDATGEKNKPQDEAVKEKDNEKNRAIDEEPTKATPISKVGRKSLKRKHGKSEGSGRPLNLNEKYPSRNMKSPKQSATSTGTPTSNIKLEKNETLDETLTKSLNRPSRIQKMPSRFLE
ncbi:unnamed protein product [Lymnaea stagnalis]|uniref:C2H2-type domain-containing protein n=1 Tax=Lymnaea stagnalis TaxID=6523 RepID=A0AAV2H0G7_LYMST